MVGAGLVSSFARPGGNITGINTPLSELDGKRQDILLEAVPGARTVAMLTDGNITPSRHIEMLKDAARARGAEVKDFVVRAPEDVASAMNEAKPSGAIALNVLATPMFNAVRKIIIERAAALRLPAIYEWPEMAEEGGLLAYGTRLDRVLRQAARVVLKVLGGVKPADIPVEQPTHYELVANLKAAKAIDFEIPAGLVLRADRVIE